MKIGNPFSWTGKVGAGTYAALGVSSFIIKHNLDRLIAHEFHEPWNLRSYWSPLTVNWANLATPDRQFLLLLLLTALPFVWIGVVFTVKRLRDAGLPLWLALLFFAPVVNLLFFALLCALPSRVSQTPSTGSIRPEQPDSWIKSRFGSATLAVTSSALIGVVFAVIAIQFAEQYGLSLFIALPFVMGYVAVCIHCQRQPIGMDDVLALVTLSVFISGVGIAAVAIEGIICLVVAAPIAWLLALAGGSLAYGIHNNRWSKREAGPALSCVLLCLPIMISVEHAAPPPVPQFQVRTSIDIAAPPEVVWKRIIAFPRLPAPHEWPFVYAGVAYPIEASIRGEGLTADRECQFSTGGFKEPILAWEPGKHFAFGVSAEPLLMTELSPYGKIHVRHLDDHDFQPERADFILTSLPNGGTRLEGTTTYRNKMWPGIYWRLWTDEIVHVIHRRVFEHVRTLAEADFRAAGPRE